MHDLLLLQDVAQYAAAMFYPIFSLTAGVGKEVAAALQGGEDRHR